MSNVDMNNLWGDSPIDPAHQRPTKDMDPIELQIHLGQHSAFVGHMDTLDKVREHLAALAQYDTVRANLLAEPEDAQPTLFGAPAQFAPGAYAAEVNVPPQGVQVNYVPDELSPEERAAISREAEALVKQQQQEKRRGGGFDERSMAALRTTVESDPADELALLRLVWLRAIDAREQAEEDLREARKWRDRMSDEAEQAYRAYRDAKGSA